MAEPGSSREVKVCCGGGSSDQDSTHELEVLKTLTAAGCSCTPKLLAFKWATQDQETMPVPGGYMIFLLMEKVPGQTLLDFDFWSFSKEKRQKMRECFRRSMKYVATMLV